MAASGFYFAISGVNPECPPAVGLRAKTTRQPGDAMPSRGTPYPAPGSGPVVRVTLVDEGGMMGPKGADYAVVEMEEALFEAVGGPEGLALVKANPRVHTGLYLAVGGIAKLGKVISGHEFVEGLSTGEE